MRSGVQGLVNEVIGYGIGAVVNRGLGIVIAFIYPILLNRDEYGRLDVIFSVPPLLFLLFLIGFDSTLARFFYEHEDIAERRRLVSTAFFTVIGFTLLSVSVLFMVSGPLALWLFGEPQYVLYFRLVLAAMPFALAHVIQTAILRLDRRIHTYNLISAGHLILSALVGILSILIFKIGVAGVLLGFILSNAATSVIGIFLNRRYLSLAPAFDRLKELLRFGLPLVASGTAYWFIGYVNRPMLAHRVSADDLGLFAIASGGVNVMAILIGAFRNAWQPFAFSIMDREDSGRVYGRTLTVFTFAATMIAVCGSLFAPEALILINAYTHKNWSGAAPSVGPLAMGILFNAMYFVVQTGIYIARRTSAIAWTMASAAVVAVLANIMLIPAYGILGAAIATALGHLTALVALYVIAQRIAPIPYQPVKITLTIFSAIIVVVLAGRLPVDSVVEGLLYKIALLILYIAALLAMRVITSRDLRMFWNVIQSALGSIRNHIRTNRKGNHADRY